MGDFKKYKVIKDRDSDYPQPILLKKGERVEIKGEYLEKKEWQGWIRCSNRKNEGWAPKQIIKIVENEGIVLEDYSANEMKIRKGEIVYGEKELNGWIWGMNTNTKEEGWVPIENIVEVGS